MDDYYFGVAIGMVAGVFAASFILMMSNEISWQTFAVLMIFLALPLTIMMLIKGKIYNKKPK